MNRIRFLSGAALAFSFFAMVTAAPAGAKVLQFPAPAPMQRPNGALENPPAEHVLPGGSSDPYEPVNRVTWKLDYDYLDHYALRPFVHGYVAVVPGPVRTGISNFTRNLGEITSFIDNICIGELGSAGINLGRFVTNSTIGLAGLIDVASYAGVPKKEMDERIDRILDLVELTMPKGWLAGEDGWYYLEAPLTSNTPVFALTSVTFNKTMGNEYQGATATVDIVAEAVQKDNNGDSALTAKGWPKLETGVVSGVTG